MMSEREKYKSIFKSTFLFGFVQIVRILVGVIKNKIVAILLGAEGMGIMGLFSNAMMLIKTGAGLGISQSAVRDISEANGSNDRTRVSRMICIVRKVVIYTSSLGLVLTIVLSPFLSLWEFGNKTYTFSLIFLSICVFFDIFVENQLAILKGMRQLRLLAKASLWGAIVGLISGVPFYYIMGVKGIVPSFIITSFSIYIVTLYYVNKIDYEKTKIPIKQAVKEASSMVKMGSALMFTTLLAYLSLFIIASYMSHEGGLSDVGYYNAGMLIINSYFGVIITALMTDYYPRIAALNQDNEKLTEELNQQSIVSILLCCPIVVIFILLLPYFVTILYTKEFLPIVNFMKIAMFGTLITIISNQADMIIVAKYKLKIFTIIAVSTRIFQVIVSVVMFKYYGLIGMGIAIVIYSLLHLVIYTIIDYTLYKIRFNKAFIRTAFIVFFITIITVFVSEINNLLMRFSIGTLLFGTTIAFLIFISKKYMGINIVIVIKSKFYRSNNSQKIIKKLKDK